MNNPGMAELLHDFLFKKFRPAEQQRRDEGKILTFELKFPEYFQAHFTAFFSSRFYRISDMWANPLPPAWFKVDLVRNPPVDQVLPVIEHAGVLWSGNSLQIASYNEKIAVSKRLTQRIVFKINQRFFT